MDQCNKKNVAYWFNKRYFFYIKWTVYYFLAVSLPRRYKHKKRLQLLAPMNENRSPF